MAESDNSEDSLIHQTLIRNLTEVRERIQAACERSDRDSANIQLVAVTKYAEWSWVQQLAVLHDQFGENRPQQLVERRQKLPDIHWHLIGQLQRNKVRSVLPSCGLIHSVENLKLYHKLADVGKELGIRPQILLQVNISGEGSKSGFQASEIAAEWQTLVARSSDIDVRGFMTMAPASQNPDEARATFRGLCELRNSIVGEEAAMPETWSLADLSMGMSGDFETAIEEGATIIRVGSALFQGLQRPSEAS